MLASLILRIASGSVKAALGGASETRVAALEIAAGIAVTAGRDRERRCLTLWFGGARGGLAPSPGRVGRSAGSARRFRLRPGDPQQMITEFGEERQRRLILDYFGGNARVRLLRRAPTFGSPIFVVDFDRGQRHFRTLGSFGSSIQVTEQSSMDMLYPARLVFHYERLMSLAFAMTRQAVTALLLGVGGAAMWRFMRAYLPDCAPTLVDADETVAAIARRWFYLAQPMTIEPAQQFVAGTQARFDVILVDLYNSSGPAETNELFWMRCLDALAPGGCLANNWADFSVNDAVRPMSDALDAVARRRGLAPIYVTRRGFRDNLVQYVPTEPGIDAEAMTEVHARFVRERNPPDRGRGILENCIIATQFPIG
jgi:spermidine synthase